MLFHTFHSQEERRKFGGSYFIEFQYCEAAPGSKPEKLLKRSLIYFEKTYEHQSAGTGKIDAVVRKSAIFFRLLYPGAIAAAAASAFFADFVCRLWNERTGGQLLPAGAKKQLFSE